MSLSPHLRLALGLAAALCLPLAAQADSFASSASSAGSASSGSASDSLKGSSNSSSGGDRKSADADYRITDVAEAPGRAGFVRVTMEAAPAQRLVLELPAAVFTPQRLAPGDAIHAAERDWGMEFARADTREAFFLVLADDWHRELEPRRVDRAS